MAKLLTGAAAFDVDGCAAGCAGTRLCCVCFRPTTVNALISRTARTTPVAMRGSCGTRRYRLNDLRPPPSLTFTTFTDYGVDCTWGPICWQCRGTVNLGLIWSKLPTIQGEATTDE